MSDELIVRVRLHNGADRQSFTGFMLSMMATNTLVAHAEVLPLSNLPAAGAEPDDDEIVLVVSTSDGSDPSGLGTKLNVRISPDLKIPVGRAAPRSSCATPTTRRWALDAVREEEPAHAAHLPCSRGTGQPGPPGGRPRYTSSSRRRRLGARRPCCVIASWDLKP
jgi:hypothetical protein